MPAALLSCARRRRSRALHSPSSHPPPQLAPAASGPGERRTAGRRGSPAKRAAGVLLLLLLALGVSEIALRQFVAPWTFSAIFRFDETQAPCYGLEPGSGATYEGWFTRVTPSRLQINSLGYRDREYSPAPDPGVLRLALLGDSHAFGLGTELEDGLSRRLEADLQRRLGRPVEVVNAGVPGYDLPKERARAARLLADYSPELLIFLVGAKDLEDRPCSFWKAGVWPLLRVSRIAVTVFVNLVIRRQRLQEMPDEARQALVLGEVSLLRALAGRAARPVRLVFAQTSELLPGSPEASAALEREIEAAGVALLPLIAPWDAVFAEPERYVVVGEGHPNAAGMALLAPALGAQLVERRLVGPSVGEAEGHP
jgi:hypothetical protein